MEFVALSSSGNWVISCSWSEVCVWNARNAELHCQLRRPKHDPEFLECDFSLGGCLADAFVGQVLLWKIKEI